MTFALGSASLGRLLGVHPALVACVRRAIATTAQDFVVLEGLRSLEQQKLNVANGVSKTLASRHLIQPDGYGHAVDLVPIIGGKPVWSWPAIYQIAAAMREASADLKTPLRWGGVWDRALADIAAGAAAMASAEAAYRVRHPGPDFVDGPHFELRPPIPSIPRPLGGDATLAA